MTVKDILKTVAVLINREEILEFLNNGYANNYSAINDDVNLLVTCYNIVAEEIATEYYKLKTIEKHISKNGVLKYSEFINNPISIISVKDKNDNSVTYKVMPSEILLNELEVFVEYCYTPQNKGLDEVSDYSSTPIKNRVIAYGVATEYLLIKGAFEEAVLWHEKYVEALKGSLIKSKMKKIKGRVWRWFLTKSQLKPRQQSKKR